MQDSLGQSERALDELEQMLRASVQPLNAEYGLNLEVPLRPALDGHQRELERVRDGYDRYVGVTQIWRLAQPDFLDRFCRLLLSRVRVVFEGIGHDVEQWCQQVIQQIDTQLRDRRQALVQRRESLARIRQAEDGLERSIAGLESLDACRASCRPTSTSCVSRPLARRRLPQHQVPRRAPATCSWCRPWPPKRPDGIAASPMMAA